MEKILYAPSDFFDGSFLVVFLLPYYFFLRFAVLADCLNALADGAPLAPAFLIFSPDPLAILFLLAWMFAYKPLFAITISPY